MTNPILRDIVASAGDLAVLPETVVHLLDLLKDDTCAAADVVKVLDRDAAMTANVLKVSNSAFFGARRRIASSRDALVMLGNRAVAALAFAAGMAPIMRRDLISYGITREQFWDHSLLSATAAARAAERLHSSVHRSEAFTAGLVHDIGMLLLDSHLLAVRKQIHPTGSAFDVCAAERKILGFDHAQAGSLLASQWGFPEFLVQAISHHHDPAAAGDWSGSVGAVAVGNLVAQLAIDDPSPETAPIVEAYLAGLGLGNDFLMTLKDDLALDFEAALAQATGPVGSGV